MKALAASLGIALPDAPDFVSASAASIIIIATLAAGWAAGEWVGPRIANFLERKAGERGEALVPRICAILRYLIVWLVLSLALRADTWPPISALLLGLFTAVAAGLVVRHAARALQLPRWASWLLAAFLFVAILADAVGGLKPVTTTLDQIAFTIGSRRLSLLILIQIAGRPGRALCPGPARQPAGRILDQARHRPRSDPAAARPRSWRRS